MKWSRERGRPTIRPPCCAVLTDAEWCKMISIAFLERLAEVRQSGVIKQGIGMAHLLSSILGPVGGWRRGKPVQEKSEPHHNKQSEAEKKQVSRIGMHFCECGVSRLSWQVHGLMRVSCTSMPIRPDRIMMSLRQQISSCIGFHLPLER